MIKRATIIISSLVVTNMYSQQNQMQNVFSNMGLTNQSGVQRQSAQVFASNTSTNKQVKNIQSNNSNRRNPVQNNVANPINQMMQPQVILNDDIQLNVLENNFGNQGIVIQQASNVSKPALPEGKGLEINLPKINFNSGIRLAKLNSHTSKNKTVHMKNKFLKMNRKLSAKFAFGKKLKLKVDDCFKW